MEGSEENCPLKPYTDEEKPTPQQQRQEQHTQKIGLGFQSSPSIGLGPSLDPSPGDLDQQTTNDELHNQKIVDQEPQILQPIREEGFRNQQPINEEFQNQQSDGKEVQNQLAITEETQNLFLEDREKAIEKGIDREDDVEGAETQANEKGVEVEERNQNNEAKGEEGTESIDDNGDDNNANSEEGTESSDNGDNNGDDNNRSENAQEDDNVNENGEGEAVSVTSLKDGRYSRYYYPLRPDAEDCSYYMRIGTCKFGSKCKFNHPSRRKNQASKEMAMEREENPERPGQIECKYYLRSGGCKFGKACRYKHGIGRAPVTPILEFNFLGLPIRLGEKECPFYMRNGSCKYGSNCRFNHPDPSVVGGGDASFGYGDGGSTSLQGASQLPMSSWSSPTALTETRPFAPVMFSPPQGVASSNGEWNGYQAPAYPIPEKRLPTPPAFALNIPVETNFYAHHKQQIIVDEYPERPGQPECSYFLKTGDCKYKSGCKFHHPKNRMPRTATCALTLSDKGLPLRPDQNICSHYNRYGICKFGPACKFDHPVNYGLSTTAPFSAEDGASSSLSNSATADDGWAWE
ncbi:hypothetical protein U1Q18_027280 [Sarracenia purpurea var. burkii]